MGGVCRDRGVCRMYWGGQRCATHVMHGPPLPLVDTQRTVHLQLRHRVDRRGLGTRAKVGLVVEEHGVFLSGGGVELRGALLDGGGVEFPGEG